MFSFTDKIFLRSKRRRNVKCRTKGLVRLVRLVLQGILDLHRLLWSVDLVSTICYSANMPVPPKSAEMLLKKHANRC